MRSRLQLDVRNLSLGRRHLVNAYEVKAGIGVIAGKTVCSMSVRGFTTKRYVNPLYLYVYLYLCGVLPRHFIRFVSVVSQGDNLKVKVKSRSSIIMMPRPLSTRHGQRRN